MSARISVTAIAAVGMFSLAFGAAAAGGSLSRKDAKFMQEVAADGLAEVELGKLAQQKAVHAEVQQFAGRMVEDHTNANAELKTIASQNGVELPTAPDRKHAKLVEKLDKMVGGDFDREYMEHMVRDHKHDVKEFRREARRKDDGPVKTFAANTLPTLEEHLEMAEKTSDIARAPKLAGDREVGSKR
jgi:putative membrane protein